MNKFYASVAALFLASQLSSPLRAEHERRGPPDPQKMEEMRAKHTEKMLETLTKKLSLSADQQKSVKAVLDQQGEKMKSMNKNFMDQRKALHESTEGEIAKLLNSDQKKQYDQWKKERKEKFEERKERREDNDK